MYLIQMSQALIYFNTSALDNYSLSTIFLLAIAYHPEYSNLMYLLYGYTSNALNGSTYGGINLVVRDSDDASFLQNVTIPYYIKCNVRCDIKVTANLFLIESEVMIVIAPLLIDNQVNLNGSVFLKNKSTQNSISDIYRQADIYRNRYVISNTNSTTFGSYSPSGIVTYTYPVFFLNANNAVFIGMTDNWVYGATDFMNITLFFYSCVECIFNGSANWTNNTKFVFTNTPISTSYRLYQGDFMFNNSNSTNNSIFWGVGDGLAKKYEVNRVSHSVLQNYSSLYEQFSASNSDSLLLYGSDHYLNRRSFDQQSDADENFLFDFGTTLKIAAISKDSSVMAVHYNFNTWNVFQFSVVDNCSLYSANYSSSHICSCFKYENSQSKCALAAATDTTAAQSSSFPIGGIIGVVVGLVVIVIVTILIKKNYRKCIKGRNRTPWKYNPVQLMSFQV